MTEFQNAIHKKKSKGISYTVLYIDTELYILQKGLNFKMLYIFQKHNSAVSSSSSSSYIYFIK